MIESVRLENFQTHKDRTITFTGGVTSIVGSSDVGKSSVLRALWWVLTNTPGGSAMVRHGAKQARVTVVIDGHEIVRTRSVSGAVNTYHLDGKELKSFGSGVPDVVARVVGVQNFHFQGQHEPAFWLSDTAGQVSKNLNAVIDLSVIDAAQQKAQANVAKQRHRLTVVEATHDHFKKVKKQLAWVADADDALSTCELLQVEATGLRQQATELAQLITDARDHRDRIDEIHRFLDEAKGVWLACRDAEKARGHVNELGTLLQGLDEAGQYTTDAYDACRAVDDAISAAKDARQAANDLARILDDAADTSQRRGVCLNEAADIESNIQKNRCPLCGK